MQLMKNTNMKLNKANLGLFIVITVLAIIFKFNKVELFFGIVIDFSSLFLLLILLIFGVKKSLITTITLIVTYVVFFNGAYIEFIYIGEIIIISYLFTKNKKTNLIVNEFIIWIIFGVLITLGILFIRDSNRLDEYYYFESLFISLNGFFNAFLADITYMYIIRKKIYKEKFMVEYKEIILHILTGAILIPFIINICIDLVNSYEYIASTTEASASEVYYNIIDELDGWNEKSITNLKLSGIIEMGLLEESINKSTRYKPFNMHLVDNKTNREILDIQNYNKSIESYEGYKSYYITDNLQKVIDKDSKLRFMYNSWRDRYLVYNNEIENLGLEVIIEIPIEIYKDRIIGEYLSQFKFLIVFALLISAVAIIINKTIFNNLYKLSMYTRNLPNKLGKDIEINWPSSNILEINLLTNNIKNMFQTMKHNFVEINKSQEKLYELAYYDTLTMLPNRLYFKKYLNNKVKENNKSEKLCVIFIDLNRFKIINDTWGHAIGDKLLKEVSIRLKSLQNDKVNIFRLGGDEFVIVASIDSEEDIIRYGNNIIKLFNKDFKIDDLVLNTSCSVGASVYPDDDNNIDTIIKYADIAMYEAKYNGGNSIKIFNEKIKEKVIEKIVIEEQINSALEKNQFTLYYQPKVSGVGKGIKSMEALIRWTSDELGVVSPDKFIPIAEESDLILEIDKWVIFKACMENKMLQNEGYEKIPISVNISAKHFAHKELLDIVKKALEISNLEAKYLIIEITEGVLIKNVDVVSELIEGLKDIGVLISIDDFGKGYSSLNQLMVLPIDEVKIDRDFIREINNDVKKKSIVKLIVELAHSLNLNAVAEGIETNEEKIYLESISCDELQGYLFSKPVKIEEFKMLLRKDKR